jgi:hypothetical protein
MMSQVLLLLGAVPFALLGAGHLVLTLRDLSRPRNFVPVDPSLIPALQQTGVAMTATGPGGQSMWRTWQGANLTHSIGLLGFAAVVLAVGATGGDLLGSQRALGPAVIVIGLAYTVVALRFWFLPAGIVAAVGTGCFIAAGVF